MRVLFVNPIGTLGGSERSLLDLAASLRETAPSLDLRLLLLGEGELGERAAALGVSVDTLALPPALARIGEGGAGASLGNGVLEVGRGALLAPAFLRRFRERALGVDPTVVHTNGMKAHLLAALALRGRPLVVHLRDLAGERPVTRRLFPLLPPASTIVVANSHAVGRDVSALSPRLRVRVVHNGIDTAAFAPGGAPSGELAALSSLAPLGPNGLAIGLVATYALWKGHRLFLRAAAKLVAAEPTRELRFYIVGGPIYGTHGSELSVADLKRAVTELGLDGRVGLVPFRSDVRNVYRELDIVVHASTRPEPFGRTIVEAMAAARPVVVARSGGAVELFEEGVTGLGFKPGDTADLVRAVLTLIRDGALRARLGAAGRAAAVAHFDRSRLGPELLAVYRELVGTSR